MVLAVLATFSPGCTCGSADAPDAGQQVGTLEPVPAPGGLVLTGVAPRPEELWQKLRIAVGGPVFFVPKSFGGATVALLGLPLALGPEFDAEVPVVFAARLSDEGKLQLACGLHVKAGDRVIGELTRGQAPPFTSSEDAASHVTLLAREGKNVSDAFTLGVLGNYLLVGTTPAALSALGPYVARTLPKEPVPVEDLTARVPESALRGPLTALLRARLEQMAKAEVPMSLLAFQALAFELVRDGMNALDGLGALDAKLVIDAQAARLSLSAPLMAHNSVARNWAAELSPGDARALGELPSHTLAALWARQGQAARMRSAKETAELVIGALGPELTDEQAEEVRGALKEMASVRGDEIVAGVGVGTFGPSAHARTDGRDAEALEKAVARLLALVELPPIQRRLAESSLRASVKPTNVERLPGRISRLRFSRDGELEGAKAILAVGMPEKVDVLMLQREDKLYVAAGLDAPEALRSLVEATGGDSLGGVASYDAAIVDLQEGTVAALMFDITGIADRLRGKRLGGTPSVVAVSLGVEPKDRSRLWLRTDVARPAIGELVRFVDAM